jgi:Flp pilus assembly protein TadG
MTATVPFRTKLNALLRRTAAEIRVRLSRTDDEDGAALVEIAFSIVILLSVVFGIMITSLALYSYFFVSEAAREGSRYAIVRGNHTSLDPSEMDCTAPGYATCIAQTGDIQTYVRSLGFPGINTANITATTTYLNPDGTACGTLDGCKLPTYQVKVTVTYPYPFNIPFVSSRTLTLSSTSQMVISH